MAIADWTETYQENQPVLTTPTRTTPLRGKASRLTVAGSVSKVGGSKSSNGRRTISVADNTTKGANMAQSTTAKKPTVKSTSAKSKTTAAKKTTASRSRKAKVTEQTLSFEFEKETPGTARFKEQNEPDNIVVGTLYIKKAQYEAMGKPSSLTVNIAVA